MQQHVIKANIDHIKKQLEFETDPPTRAMLLKCLSDERGEAAAILDAPSEAAVRRRSPIDYVRGCTERWTPV